MLTPDQLQRIRFTDPSPGWQPTLAHLLGLNYALVGAEIVVEGLDRLPQDRPVFIAMNHTDRYGCWPLQWRMLRLGLSRPTATWVKGKYFENPLMSAFMIGASNIPMPSRGYLIAGVFQQRTGSPPDGATYRLLRDLLDGRLPPDTPQTPTAARFMAGFGGPEGFITALSAQFDTMMAEVMRMHREALGPGRRHILVFPEGTRSPTLLRGRTGLAQVTQHLGIPIVPVGCSGSDTLYPANSPWAKKGRVVYRIGEVLEPDGEALSPYRITEDFVPMSRAASEAHGQRLQSITDVVMRRISDLVDPRYRARSSRPDSDGMDRFL
ncbi:MAG: lysophospholipid acyltransferase family protein [Myxococcota bacterium]|nr:lysophospholipid acyltransferase family protein [Myxococcota bacterium]